MQISRVETTAKCINGRRTSPLLRGACNFRRALFSLQIIELFRGKKRANVSFATYRPDSLQVSLRGRSGNRAPSPPTLNRPCVCCRCATSWNLIQLIQRNALDCISSPRTKISLWRNARHRQRATEVPAICVFAATPRNLGQDFRREIPTRRNLLFFFKLTRPNVVSHTRLETIAHSLRCTERNYPTEN